MQIAKIPFTSFKQTVDAMPGVNNFQNVFPVGSNSAEIESNHDRFCAHELYEPIKAAIDNFVVFVNCRRKFPSSRNHYEVNYSWSLLI